MLFINLEIVLPDGILITCHSAGNHRRTQPPYQEPFHHCHWGIKLQSKPSANIQIFDVYFCRSKGKIGKLIEKHLKIKLKEKNMNEKTKT